MKIVLFGKSGLLGSQFEEKLRTRGDVELFAYDSSELDITDSAGLRSVLEGIEPDIVLNCAAYTNVDAAESEREMAFLVNSKAAGEIAELCGDALLIQFSTDYVFDGSKHGYREDDVTSPINVYGSSKLSGENLVRVNARRFAIIRSSWLFGPNGKNFVDTMLKIGTDQDNVDVVENQVGSPTYSVDLCEAVIANFIEPELRGVKIESGIYHLSNEGECSWADFAREIFRLSEMDVDVRGVSSAVMGRKAKRPAFSVLLNSKLPKLRHWKEALREYLGVV